MLPFLPPIEESKQQKQAQYRRLLEAQIAEKVPGKASNNHGGNVVVQGPPVVMSADYYVAPSVSDVRDSASVAVGGRDARDAREAARDRDGYVQYGQHRHRQSTDFEMLAAELSEMKSIIGKILPKVESVDVIDKRSKAALRNMDGLKDQFDSLQNIVRESESKILKTELNLVAQQTRDRESNAISLHQFKLLMSNVVGLGADSRTSATEEVATTAAAASHIDALEVGKGLSLLERQSSLEATVKQDLSVIKRAVADLKSRVASTHILLSESSSSSEGQSNQKRSVSGDIIDGISKSISKLSQRSDQQDQRLFDVDKVVSKVAITLDDKSNFLAGQIEEMKTVLSAEITGRRKGQSKIQTILDGLLAAQLDKEDIHSVRREMQIVTEQLNLRLDATERLVHTMTNTLRREIEDSKEFSRAAINSIREEMRTMFQSVRQQQSDWSQQTESEERDSNISAELLLLKRRVSDVEERTISVGNSIVVVEDVMNAGFKSVANNLRSQQSDLNNSMQSVTELINQTKAGIEVEVEEVVMNIGRALRALQQQQQQPTQQSGKVPLASINESTAVTQPHSQAVAPSSITSANRLRSPQLSSQSHSINHPGSKQLHSDSAISSVTTTAVATAVSAIAAASAATAIVINSARQRTASQLSNNDNDACNKSGAAEAVDTEQHQSEEDGDSDLDDVISPERIAAINFVYDRILSEAVLKRTARKIVVANHPRNKLLLKKQHQQQQQQDGNLAVPQALPIEPSTGASVVATTVAEADIAARKIQSVARGASTRSRVNMEAMQQHQQQQLSQREQLPRKNEIQSDGLITDTEAQLAAQKIQSVARGASTRSRLSKNKEDQQPPKEKQVRDDDLVYPQQRTSQSNADDNEAAATAARKIQAVARGAATRMKLNLEREFESADLADPHAAAAALKIQSVARGAATRTKISKQKQLDSEAAAALKIQSVARGAATRSKISKERNAEAVKPIDDDITEALDASAAALKIQSVARGAAVRTKFNQERQREAEAEAAARKIQSVARGNATRSKVNKEQGDQCEQQQQQTSEEKNSTEAAALKIQSLARGAAVRNKAGQQKKTETEAVIKIQSVARGAATRSRIAQVYQQNQSEVLDKDAAAARKIQSVARGVAIRTRINKERQEEVEKTIQSNAAIIIQSSFRGAKSRKDVAEIKKQSMEQELQADQSAAIIQARVRGALSRKQYSQMKLQETN